MAIAVDWMYWTASQFNRIGFTLWYVKPINILYANAYLKDGEKYLINNTTIRLFRCLQLKLLII